MARLAAAVTYWSDSWSSLLFGDGLFSFSHQFRGRYTGSRKF